VSGYSPDFEGLGVVAGDLVAAYNASTNTYIELEVESVSANTVVFTNTTWTDGLIPIGTTGSMVTFLPNRVIQGKGYPVACSSAPSPTDLVMPVSVVDTGHVGLIYGFHVKAPPAGECVLGVISSNDQGSAQLNNIVVSDYDRAGTFYASAIEYVATQTQFLAYAGQTAQQPFGWGPITATVLSVLGDLRVIVESQAAVTMGSWNIIGHITQSFGAGTQYILELNMHTPRSSCGYVVTGGKIESEILFLSGGTASSMCMSGSSTFSEVSGPTTITNENAGAVCIKLTETAAMTLVDANDVHFFKECDVAFYVNGSAILNIGTAQSGGIGTFTNVDTELSMDETARVAYGNVAQKPAFNHGASGPISAAFSLQNLDGTGALAMTMTAPLSDFLYKEYAIFSRTAYAHNVTLTGATWDGTNTIAVFPGTVGAGIEFRVLSDTIVSIVSNVGSVTFQT
jgi:hypothetical protein